MTITSLEIKLNSLRDKWSKDFPKDTSDRRWPEFCKDKSEAEHLKSIIEKIKQMDDPDDVTIVDCYQCGEKEAISGPLFPYCSEECKKQWQDDHHMIPQVGHRKTIEEIQRQLKEMGRRPKTISPTEQQKAVINSQNLF